MYLAIDKKSNPIGMAHTIEQLTRNAKNIFSIYYFNESRSVYFDLNNLDTVYKKI